MDLGVVWNAEAMDSGDAYDIVSSRNFLGMFVEVASCQQKAIDSFMIDESKYPILNSL